MLLPDRGILIMGVYISIERMCFFRIMTLIKGKQSVISAIQSESTVKEIILSQSIQHSPEIKRLIALAQKQSIPIHITTAQAFQTQFGHEKNAQGIVAKIASPALKTIKDLITNASNYPFIVALDHLQDPYNVGAIFRTCESLGFGAVIFPKDRQVQLTPGVLKASSGAFHYLDLIQVVNLAQGIEQLKKAGYWVYAATSEKGTALPKIEPLQPAVLILGNEHKGISKRLTKLVDVAVQIPTTGHTESLNVSVAAGILLYHFSQHRDA